ncbi:hypothetical protein JR316_0011361 [Psilocybe cubensis]|uniref:Uncharacterized protein n=2 Tax=Psilocybe cubensis TaxID=181762 RepID=A0ACB8GJU8_PSICU|nr:hypothetical protein JR316_0011361 [Psilocybe cubensis]KAH9475801.1 hypothetical protein JR316_0011361 [Psilocybe cubensis]
MQSRAIGELAGNNDLRLQNASVRHTLLSLPASQLHSSFVPTPMDEIVIESGIQNVKSTLNSVNEQISRLRSTLAELETYREDLHTTLLQHRSVLSSQRKLPPEILGEIFLLAADGCRLTWPPTNASADEMPWLLCKVCSYWRTVAYSLPKLWSEVHMDIRYPIAVPSSLDSDVADTTYESTLRLGERFLQTCLDRSGNQLLTFSIKVDGLLDKAHSFLEMLVQHSERWEDVSLHLDIFSHHSILAPARDRVPNLRRLHIGTSLSDSMPPTPLDAFENAPKLKELSLTRIIHPFHIIRLPWSQITHLTSNSNTFSEGEFTLIMRHTDNLTSFTTHRERILEVASSDPVPLNHLRYLEIVNKGSYIAKTFQFLTTPNLQELHIQALTPFLADQTIPMLTRAQCKPTHLVFHSSLVEEAVWEENFGIIWLLGGLPSVVNLHLTALRSSEEIMSRLSYRRPQTNSPPFLPNLHTIVLEDRHCRSALNIAETLSSRIRTNSTGNTLGSWTFGEKGLKSISLRLSHPPGPAFPELNVLKNFAVKHGVAIDISSSG